MGTNESTWTCGGAADCPRGRFSILSSRVLAFDPPSSSRPDLDTKEAGGLARKWIAEKIREADPKSRLGHQQVGRLFQDLIERGLLERADESYANGRMAQTWRVKGPLLDLWRDARSASGKVRVEAALVFLRREHPMAKGRSYESTPTWRLLVQQNGVSEEDMADIMAEGSTCAATRTDHLKRLLHLTKGHVGLDDEAYPQVRAQWGRQSKYRNRADTARSRNASGYPSSGDGPRWRRSKERAS